MAIAPHWRLLACIRVVPHRARCVVVKCPILLADCRQIVRAWAARVRDEGVESGGILRNEKITTMRWW